MAAMDGAARGLQDILGPEMDALGRATGVVQRVRRFSGSSLVRMLVLTLLGKANPDIGDFHTTAAQLGIAVSLEAVAKRFSPQLVDFLREVLAKTLRVVLDLQPVMTPLLARFTAVLIGDSPQRPDFLVGQNTLTLLLGRLMPGKGGGGEIVTALGVPVHGGR